MSTYRKQVNLMRRKHVRLAAVCHSNAEVEMRIVGYRTSSWGGGCSLRCRVSSRQFGVKGHTHRKPLKSDLSRNARLPNASLQGSRRCKKQKLTCSWQ